MKAVLVAGATGAVGQKLVEQLLAHPDEITVHLLSRRATRWQRHPQVVEHILPLESIHRLQVQHKLDAVCCCLGTTIKQAGSKDNFTAVDVTAVVALADWSKRLNVPQFHVISSIGVSAKNRSFYLASKYQMEQQVSGAGFQSTYIYRPSLLLADRTKYRLAESLSGSLMKLFRWLPNAKRWQPIEVERVAATMANNVATPQTGLFVVTSAQMQSSVVAEMQLI